MLPFTIANKYIQKRPSSPNGRISPLQRLTSPPPPALGQRGFTQLPRASSGPSRERYPIGDGLLFLGGGEGMEEMMGEGVLTRHG